MQLNSNHIVTEAVAKSGGGSTIKEPRVKILNGKPVVGRGMGFNGGGTFFMDTDGELWIGGYTMTSHNNAAQLGMRKDYLQRPLRKIELDYASGVKDFGYIGGSSCFILMNDGRLYCWGNNASGALGIGTNNPNALAYLTQVAGLWDEVNIACTFGYNETVSMWYLRQKGTDNWFHLGSQYAGIFTSNPTNTANNHTPEPVVNPEGEVIDKLWLSSASDGNVVCLTKSRKLYVVGRNIYGSASVDSTAEVRTWAPMAGVPAVLTEQQAATIEFYFQSGFVGSKNQGEGRNMFMLLDGDLYSCGHNLYQTLGHPEPDSINLLKKIDGLPKIVKMFCGQFGPTSNFAITADGDVWTWGYNEAGESGQGTVTPVREPVLLMQNVVDVFNRPAPISYGYRPMVHIKKTDGSIVVAGWYGMDAMWLADKTVTDGTVKEFKETLWSEDIIHIEYTGGWGATAYNTTYAFTSDGRIYTVGRAAPMMSKYTVIPQGLVDQRVTEPLRYF